MWYKKFCRVWLWAMLLSVLFPFVSMIVDPYNVFHWDNIRYNGIEPNKNYIKTKYILHNPNKYDSFLFGSSRVGVIHTEKLNSVRTYNMTYSEGIPVEHLWNIQTFLKNNIMVKKIYIGIDDILLYAKATEHETQHLRSQYEFAQSNFWSFAKMYVFSPRMIAGSLRHYKISGTSSEVEQIYKNGWWGDYDQKSNYDWSQVKSVQRTNAIINKDIFGETLESMKEIKRICDANKIELVVFTNPTYRTTYIGGLNKGYIEFLRELVKTTNFYNLSGLNDITTNRENYYETSHYKAYVGDMIIDVIHNNKKFDKLYEQGFGWYVTQDNIEKLLNLIDVKEGSY